VSAAASLLTCILAHNRAALSRLYLSGAFLFGLAYCGSNLEELAGLFKTAHLAQGFRCDWLLLGIRVTLRYKQQQLPVNT
jgi:hypothetical protein